MLTRKKPKKTPLILRRKLCFSHAEAVTDFPTNNYIYCSCRLEHATYINTHVVRRKLI